jgi:type I restriction enzyme M protein
MDNTTAHQANALAGFVWQIAEILRGDFKQSEYGRVILPFVVLRPLDCILEPTKDAVLRPMPRSPKGSTSRRGHDTTSPQDGLFFSNST